MGELVQKKTVPSEATYFVALEARSVCHGFYDDPCYKFYLLRIVPLPQLLSRQVTRLSASPGQAVVARHAEIGSRAQKPAGVCESCVLSLFQYPLFSINQSLEQKHAGNSACW